MDTIVAIWLVFSAFILGANTGTPEDASSGVEDFNAMAEAHPDVPDGESAQEHACSTGPQGRIYRDLIRPHVRNSE